MPYNTAGGCLELIDSRVALGRDYRPDKSALLYIVSLIGPIWFYYRVNWISQQWIMMRKAGLSF